MSMPLDVRQTLISRLLDGAVCRLESLADGLRMAVTAAKARRAARQTADELAHLDPAILADIGIDAAANSPVWTMMATASPHCLAMRELGRKPPRG